MIGAAYLIGLAWFAGADNTASRDPRRFWWVLVLWWVVAPIGAINSLLNRL